jgi:hypothetical protein
LFGGRVAIGTVRVLPGVGNSGGIHVFRKQLMALVAAVVLGVVALGGAAVPASASTAWHHWITTPSNGETVRGEVIYGSMGYQGGGRAFFVDGREVGRTFECTDIDVGCEYQIIWDSRTVANGQHELKTAVIYQGQFADWSDPITVTVAN